MIDIDELERITKAGDRYGHVTLGRVLELIAEVRRLREEVQLLTATQAACDNGSCEHDGCQQSDLTGYRETAAKWVTEYLASKRDASRYQRLKSFAHPSYNMAVIINELSASLSKREFLTVHAGTWDAMDAVLDGIVVINTVNVKESA